MGEGEGGGGVVGEGEGGEWMFGAVPKGYKTSQYLDKQRISDSYGHAYEFNVFANNAYDK